MNERTERLSEYLVRLRKHPPANLDALAADIHEEVFSRTDCLSCTQCCRTLGPRLTRPDITRISRVLRIPESQIETSWLRTDEDGDWVFKTLPCPFLGADGYCLIYPERPKACREYPHTDRNFTKAVKLTILNLETCPAVRDIVKNLKDRCPA